MTKIYLVSNIDNDPNKVYIGKTKKNRKKDHIKTYGSQINYTYIDEIQSLNRKDWEPLETKWIQHYIDLGYNVINKRKKGGNGPEYRTEEEKSKISKGNLGKEKKGVSLYLKNKPKPLGFGDKISKALKGKKRSEKAKQNISKGHLGKKRNNFKKGKENKNFGKNKSKTHSLNISKAKTGLSRPDKNIPIIQHDLQNNFIKEWSSVNDALKFLNIKGISNVLSNRSKSAGGFKWKYKNA
jgi:hypothetical protein